MAEEPKGKETPESPLRIRLNCSGWYDRSTGKVLFRGQIFEGKEITVRMRKAFDEQETFRDPVSRVKKVVFEEVPVPPAPRPRTTAQKVNLEAVIGPKGKVEGDPK